MNGNGWIRKTENSILGLNSVNDYWAMANLSSSTVVRTYPFYTGVKGRIQ